MSGINPYWLACASAHGVESHELRPVDFLTWLGPRWREWARENGKPEHGHRSDEDHENFERWLCERGRA